MKDYYKIVRHDRVGKNGTHTLLRLVNDSTKWPREIASIHVEPAEGTVYQLQYPSTKSYGGPETADAIAQLMLMASEVASSGGL